MNEQLERQIQADFPFMKMNKIDGEENLYRRWGCDCDDGWYELIHDMCQAITDRYAKEGLPIDLILHSSKKNSQLFDFITRLREVSMEVQPLTFWAT